MSAAHSVGAKSEAAGDEAERLAEPETEAALSSQRFRDRGMLAADLVNPHNFLKLEELVRRIDWPR